MKLLTQAICFALLVLAGPNAYGEVPRQVKLGAIVSLTGDAARNGINWLEGAQLAIDDLKNEGNKVELVVEDDGTTPSKVAAAFLKLATIDKVSGIVGGTWDFLAETAYPLAKQYKVPFITPTNPVEVLSTSARANPWIFTNGPTLKEEQREIEHFLRNRKIKTIGLAYINVPYGTVHADLVRETAKSLNISIVSDNVVSYQGFLDSIKISALKIANAHVDLAFVVLNYEGVDLFLRELQRAHASPIVLMTHTLKEAYDFGGSPARYSSSYGIYPKVTSQRFQEKFRDKYHRDPTDYAALGYDATIFMEKLVHGGPVSDIDKVALEYEGVSGNHLLPTKDRNVTNAQANIMAIQGGNLVEFTN